MLMLPASVRIYLAVEPADMRWYAELGVMQSYRLRRSGSPCRTPARLHFNSA
jgi:hypothetical protein